MRVWRLKRRIAAGGWGEVHEAVSPEGEAVAVKVLASVGEAEKARFEQQVRLLLRLKHPAIAAVRGYLLKSDAIFGEDRGPCYWMEYVEGRDLPEACAREAPETVLRWFREALEVLASVHSQKTIHGDLSPRNLRIDANGKLRLLDFSVLPEDPATAEVATLPYMAPERIDGRLSPAGDLFSLGTVFYEALSGRHPRAGCPNLQAMIRAVPEPLVEVAPRLKAFGLAARVIDRMIRSDLTERLSDAGKILELLDQKSWKEPDAEALDYYPVRMLGADRAFAEVQEALETVTERSAVFAVHGPAGTGKTRFAREAAFEAAMKGAEVREFFDLHAATPEALRGVLESLRSFPPKGVAALLSWNDDRLSPVTERFFSNLVSQDFVREIRLGDLSEEDSVSLLKGVLDEEDAQEAVAAVRKRAGGNPSRILEAIRLLISTKKIKGRRLKPGWKDLVADFDPPKELLKALLGDASPESIRSGALAAAETLRKEGRAAEALGAVDYALGFVKDPDEVSRLLRLKANLLGDLGRLEEAIAVCDQGFALKAADEPAVVKEVKYWLVTGLHHQNLGRVEEAEARLRRCLQTAEKFPEDAEAAPHAVRALATLGHLELERGNLSAARASFQKGLDRSGPHGARRAELLRHMAVVRSREGDWESARRLLNDAKALYRGEAHAEGEFATLLQEGNLAAEQGRMEEAEEAYLAAEAAARRAGSDLRLALAWNNLGFLDRVRGRLGPALERLHKAHDVFRFFGNPKDLKENLNQLAVAEASVGRFARADGLLKELNEPESNVAKIVSDLRDGTADGSPDEIKKNLEAVYRGLPPELKVTFVERGDYRKWVSPPPQGELMKDQPAGVLPALQALNGDLLRETDMTRVLQRLMDAALKMADAENGFLVLKNELSQDGPLPGYEIAVARNVTREEIQTEENAFSLSAVRHALQKGEPVVTDNALEDPLFRNAKSVHLKKLKSILALPIRGADGILGVFYLDHRFQDGVFEGGVMEAMETFASVAALALQKGVMIEDLRRANAKLSEDVADRSDRVQVLEKELKKSRLVLKNEYSDIVGRSPKMIEVLSLVDRLTDADVPVWVFGESGTGKEAVARSLHFNGGRAKKPFVTENCSALPEGLLESELFGHKKGSFTHAVSDKKGILQYADGGTIFLDEIADMSLNLQAKLLRFLQEGEIRPIGSPETVRVDVRVVSASNKDLLKLVEEGKFREDLFYRLNGVTVRLPPLRERLEDLPLLADHFLKKIAEKSKKPACRLDPAVLRVFLNYAWPGNIRELQNTLQTAVLFVENGVVTAHSLNFKPALFEGARAAAPTTVPRRPAEPLDPELERTLLAVRDHCYHKADAAKSLGIARRTLYARLQRFGIGTDRASLKAEIEKVFG